MDGLGMDTTITPGAMSLSTPLAGGAGLASRQSAFRDVLAQASGRGDARTRETPEQRARSAAEQLVAISFVQPILAQVREAKDAAPPFAPTEAEKQFGALMDARVAHELVRGSRLPLVDRLAQNLLARSGARTEASP
ncbi:MAG: hypothetical protein RBS39_01250 [Phycisphaerales bacterium]|jgi:hypothetical protein|nr:hypothetical protein [Phycisphaerales bacterium]